MICEIRGNVVCRGAMQQVHIHGGQSLQLAWMIGKICERLWKGV